MADQILPGAFVVTMFSRFSQDVAGGMGLMSMREYSEYHSAQQCQMSASAYHNAKMIISDSVLSTMYHLSRNGARFQMFAPNQQQMNVMDHMRKQPASGENR